MEALKFHFVCYMHHGHVWCCKSSELSWMTQLCWMMLCTEQEWATTLHTYVHFMEIYLIWTAAKLHLGYFDKLLVLTRKQDADTWWKEPCIPVSAAWFSVAGALQAHRKWVWEREGCLCLSVGLWQWGFACQHPHCMAGTAAVSNQEEAIVSFWLLQTGLIWVLFIQVFLSKFSKDPEFDLCICSFPSN